MCSSENTVKLNVGGTVFETLKSTLTKHEGFFKTIMETGVPAEKDDKNRFFIDRSPKHFETVLNYMRSGVAILPDSEKELRELKEEAEYYLLEDLAILSQPPNKIRTYDSTPELLQFIANTKKPVILINYLTHKNKLVYLPNAFEFSKLMNCETVEIYFHATETEEPMPLTFVESRRFMHPATKSEPCWKFRIFNHRNSYWDDLKSLPQLKEIIDRL